MQESLEPYGVHDSHCERGQFLSIAKGLFTQIEVVHALALRETRTRFGVHQLGYLWALLEPTLMIVTFYALFAVAKHSPQGFDVWGYVGTGVIPYALFSNSVARAAGCIQDNRALLYYPQVQPIDFFWARSWLELMTFFGVFIVLLGGGALYRQEFAIGSPLLVIAGMVSASMLGSFLGLIFGTLSQVNKVANRARGPLIRPLFWISGIFFIPEALPSDARELLIYNPVLHAVSTVRSGWYEHYSSSFIDFAYVGKWILALAVTSLLLEKLVRKRIGVT